MEMNNIYYKNRTFIYIIFTISIVYVSNMFVSSAALSIEKGLDIVNSEDIEDAKLIYISIPQGSSATDITSILSNRGVISSSLAYEIYLRNENMGDKLRAGDYEILNNLEFDELTSILLKGPPLKTYNITIPEGLWINETLESISLQTGFSVESLRNSLISGIVTSKYVYLGDYKKLEHWEGLIYPNTYEINVDANGEEILQTLVSELENVTFRIFTENELPTWIDNYNQLFTIASLIEAESKLDEDRPLVASVIKNRLYDNMLLQIDATVLYALQKRKPQVLLVDLQVDSKYNTYKYNGLPPTPISGFGERSIIAILNAPQSDFIYYLLTDKNGKMSFTDNYTDFINMKNKAKEEGVIP
tara:strand:- start:632 stop:1711 length:1080 start_codon:yes stop_codon:yes gene_type:complete